MLVPLADDGAAIGRAPAELNGASEPGGGGGVQGGAGGERGEDRFGQAVGGGVATSLWNDFPQLQFIFLVNLLEN